MPALAGLLAYAAVLLCLITLPDDGDKTAFTFRLASAILVGALVALLVWLRERKPRE